MEGNQIQTYLTNLDGEISLREELLSRYLNQGSKLYLLMRNVGTLMTVVGLIWAWWRNSNVGLIITLVSFLICIWLTDYLDYSSKILTEMRLISILKEQKSLMLHSHVEDVTAFIVSSMTTVSEERQGATFISESAATQRGLEIAKKSN